MTFKEITYTFCASLIALLLHCPVTIGWFQWAICNGRLDKAATAYGMEISAETNLMTNNTSGINTEIKMNGKKFEIVITWAQL